MATQDHPFCKTVHIPVHTIRWGLAGLQGALHGFHSDARAAGSWIQCDCGQKVVFFAVPKEGDCDTFRRIDFFLSDPPFDTRASGQHKWDVEYVVLSAGDAV